MIFLTYFLLALLVWFMVGFAVCVAFHRITIGLGIMADFYMQGDSVLYIIMSFFWPLILVISITYVVGTYWKKFMNGCQIKKFFLNLDKMISEFVTGGKS